MLNDSETMPHIGAPLERISLLTGLVMIGLTLALLLEFPSGRLGFSIFGSEVSLVLSGTWLLALILAALSAAGVDSIVRLHPRVHLGETRYIFILWILPVVIVVTGTLLLTLTEVRVYGLVSVALTGALFFLAILGEFYSIDVADRFYSAARLGVNLVVYLVALVLFATIYGWKIRSLISSPAIGLAAGFLSLELLRGAEEDFRRTWLYAAAVGLILGELAWALNYWNLSGFIGGGLLFIFFYIFTGLVQQYLWKRLSARVLIEFAAIGLGALALLAWLRPV